MVQELLKAFRGSGSRVTEFGFRVAAFSGARSLEDVLTSFVSWAQGGEVISEFHQPQRVPGKKLLWTANFRALTGSLCLSVLSQQENRRQTA